MSARSTYQESQSLEPLLRCLPKRPGLSGLFRSSVPPVEATALAASQHCLLVGTSVGSVHLLDRSSRCLHRQLAAPPAVLPMVGSAKIACTAVGLGHSLETLAVAGFEDSRVVIYLEPPPSPLPPPPMSFQHQQQQQPPPLPSALRSPSFRRQAFQLACGHRGSRISSIAVSLNCQKVFVGDRGGTVSRTLICAPDGTCESSVFLEEMSPIMKLEYCQRRLLVASEAQVAVYTDDTSCVWLVGGKRWECPRPLGACFLPDPQLPSRSSVLCAQPNWHLWLADHQGRLQANLRVPEVDCAALRSRPIPLLTPSRPLLTLSDSAAGPAADAFVGVTRIPGTRHAALWNRSAMFLLNVDSGELIGSTDLLAPLLDVLATDSGELMALRAGTALPQVVRLTTEQWTPAPSATASAIHNSIGAPASSAPHLEERFSLRSLLDRLPLGEGAVSQLLQSVSSANSGGEADSAAVGLVEFGEEAREGAAASPASTVSAAEAAPAAAAATAFDDVSVASSMDKEDCSEVEVRRIVPKKKKLPTAPPPPSPPPPPPTPPPQQSLPSSSVSFAERRVRQLFEPLADGLESLQARVNQQVAQRQQQQQQQQSARSRLLAGLQAADVGDNLADDAGDTCWRIGDADVSLEFMSAKASSSSQTNAKPVLKLSLEQNNLKMEDSKLQPDDSKLQPEESNLQPEESKLQPDDSKLQPDDSKLQPDDSKLQLEESKLQPEESKLQPDDSKPQPEESKLRPEESKLRPEESNLQPEESKLQPEESKLQPDDSKPQPEESKLQPDDSKPQPEESKLQPDDYKLQPDDSKLQPDDSKLQPEDSKLQLQDVSDQPQDPMVQSISKLNTDQTSPSESSASASHPSAVTDCSPAQVPLSPSVALARLQWTPDESPVEQPPSKSSSATGPANIDRLRDPLTNWWCPHRCPEPLASLCPAPGPDTGAALFATKSGAAYSARVLSSQGDARLRWQVESSLSSVGSGDQLVQLQMADSGGGAAWLFRLTANGRKLSAGKTVDDRCSVAQWLPVRQAVKCIGACSARYVCGIDSSGCGVFLVPLADVGKPLAGVTVTCPFRPVSVSIGQGHLVCAGSQISEHQQPAAACYELWAAPLCAPDRWWPLGCCSGGLLAALVTEANLWTMSGVRGGRGDEPAGFCLRCWRGCSWLEPEGVPPLELWIAELDKQLPVKRSEMPWRVLTSALAGVAGGDSVGAFSSGSAPILTAVPNSGLWLYWPERDLLLTCPGPLLGTAWAPLTPHGLSRSLLSSWAHVAVTCIAGREYVWAAGQTSCEVFCLWPEGFRSETLPVTASLGVKLVQLCCGQGTVWALCTDGQLYLCQGINDAEPFGLRWKRLKIPQRGGPKSAASGGPFVAIACSGGGLYGLGSGGGLWLVGPESRVVGSAAFNADSEAAAAPVGLAGIAGCPWSGAGGAMWAWDSKGRVFARVRQPSSSNSPLESASCRWLSVAGPDMRQLAVSGGIVYAICRRLGRVYARSDDLLSGGGDWKPIGCHGRRIVTVAAAAGGHVICLDSEGRLVRMKEQVVIEESPLPSILPTALASRPSGLAPAASVASQSTRARLSGSESADWELV